MAMVCQRRAPTVTGWTSASLPPIRAAWKRRAERAEAEDTVCTDPGACDGFGAGGVWSEASGASMAMDVRWRWETRAAGPGGSGRERTNPKPDYVTTSTPIAEREGEALGGARRPKPLSAPHQRGAPPKRAQSNKIIRLKKINNV